MDGAEAQGQAQENTVTDDPWAAAFAALEQKDQKGSEEDPSADRGTGDDRTAEDSDGHSDASDDEMRHGSGTEGDIGGSGSVPGDSDQEDADDEGSLFNLSEEELTGYRKQVEDQMTDRAIDEISKAFIDKGIRHQDGKLGASINDPDICKRDEDGVPRFFNPDTGREFSGDNPRRQAQEWVEDYNKELAEAFNKACGQYVDKLMEDQAPQLAVLEFGPKYDQLDPIRQGLLDSIIEDYEITDDDGAVIGYTCSLDAALGAVNRQVAMIQEYYRSNHPSEKQEASGPALDMKNSAAMANRSGEAPNFKSLEEAMEYEQNKLLEKMKKGAR